MSGTITELKYQTRNQERVNIYLDGRYSFALPAIEAARLRKGQFLSDEEISRLHNVDEEAKAYDAAVRFLGFRPRSRMEVKRYLREREVDDELAEKILERLSNAGYLDDLAFAHYWVENREQFRPRSAVALRQELHEKGVSDADIREVLSVIDQRSGAYTIAAAQARRWLGLGEAGFTQKVQSLLARRGYPYGIARQVARQLWQESGAHSEIELGSDE